MSDLTRDLEKLNTMTKYPSIPTYHDILGGDGKGRLLDTHLDIQGPVIATEKVDGTNGRILLFGGDFLLGTREEFVYAKGDRIGSPAEGVMVALKPVAERICTEIGEGFLAVIFGEVYGRGIGARGQNYASGGPAGFRVFDIMLMTEAAALEELTYDRAQISGWRQHGHQPFLRAATLDGWVFDLDLQKVPHLTVTDAANLPDSHGAMLEWLKQTTPATRCALDDAAQGRSEGVVVRSADRQHIAKIRFEDYERTLRPCRACGMVHAPGANALCSR